MQAYDFNYCLNKIRNGHTRWLEEIYKEYYEKMKLKAWLIVKNVQTAEDIASDFIKYILQNANEIGNIEYPNAWIYSSIHNNSINYIRRNGKTDYIEDIKEDRLMHTVNYDLYCAFNEALKNLSENEKELALLHFLYGLKYKEISKMIQKPMGTIKSAISRIKDKLKVLKDYF